ncbi:hypothetical protein BJX99DRAFT_258714 [Aspergillus californicus]
MLSPTVQTFTINELTEQILLHLPNPLEILRAQRVCRTWRDLIQTSPALREACWYTYQEPPDSSDTTLSSQWTLNPAFSRLGFSISKDFTPDERQDRGDFSFKERIYDTPGSWTSMLATRPPVQRMVIECYGNYSGDETMYYHLVSKDPTGLLIGEVIATLAEAQNRQESGIDRWAGVRHYTGALTRWIESDWDSDSYRQVIGDMPDDADVNVAVTIPWGRPEGPAFSLRRVAFGCGGGFLCEMVVHLMVMSDGEEYEWDYWHHGGLPGRAVCGGRGYEANLVVVRELPEWYLGKCGHVFRRLSDLVSSDLGRLP